MNLHLKRIVAFLSLSLIAFSYQNCGEEKDIQVVEKQSILLVENENESSELSENQEEIPVITQGDYSIQGFPGILGVNLVQPATRTITITTSRADSSTEGFQYSFTLNGDAIATVEGMDSSVWFDSSMMTISDDYLLEVTITDTSTEPAFVLDVQQTSIDVFATPPPMASDYSITGFFDNNMPIILRSDLTYSFDAMVARVSDGSMDGLTYVWKLNDVEIDSREGMANALDFMGSQMDVDTDEDGDGAIDVTDNMLTLEITDTNLDPAFTFSKTGVVNRTEAPSLAGYDISGFSTDDLNLEANEARVLTVDVSRVADSSTDGITFAWYLNDMLMSSTNMLTVSGDMLTLGNDYALTLQISDIKENPAFQLPLLSRTARQIVPAAIAQFTPTSTGAPIDFGRLNANTSVNRTFTITNNGNAPLILVNRPTTVQHTQSNWTPQSGANGMTIVGNSCPTNLAAGSTCTYTVRFTNGSNKFAGGTRIEHGIFTITYKLFAADTTKSKIVYLRGVKLSDPNLDR